MEIGLEAGLTKKIDDIDMQIISLLQEDSRLSFNKIVYKLGISVGTVCNHVKSLEDRVVLKGYTVLVGSNKNSRSHKSVKNGEGIKTHLFNASCFH